MTLRKFLPVGFLPAVGCILFVIGAATDLHWLVLAGIIVAGVASIATIVIGALAKSKSTILTAIGGIATVAGCASWFILPESAVNIAGLVAMVLGSIILVVSTSLSIVDK